MIFYFNNDDHEGSEAKELNSIFLKFLPVTSIVCNEGAPLTPEVSLKNINILPFGAQVGPSSIKAFVNFNGTGTVATRNTGNVSSVTDNGTGDYTVNFNNALPANYGWAVGANVAVGSYTGYPVLKTDSSGTPSSLSSSAFRLNTNESSNVNAVDVHYVNLTFIG